MGMYHHTHTQLYFLYFHTYALQLNVYEKGKRRKKKGKKRGKERQREFIEDKYNKAYPGLSLAKYLITRSCDATKDCSFSSCLPMVTLTGLILYFLLSCCIWFVMSEPILRTQKSIFFFQISSLQTHFPIFTKSFSKLRDKSQLNFKFNMQ